MSHWKTFGYGCVVAPMPFLGYALGRLVDNPYRETVEAVPVLICAILVLRLPTVSPRRDTYAKLPRVLLLAAPFAVLPLMSPLGNPGAVLLSLAIVDVIAIGVSEELTFRFSLHRLLSPYGNTFYLVVSSLVFGVMHFPGGMSAVVVTAIIGLLFALSRIGGMPIIVLILLHGLIDLPGRIAAYAEP